MSKVMLRHSAQCCLRMGQEVTRHYFIEAPFSPEKLATPSHQSAALLLAASSAATWKGVRHPRPLAFSHSDKQERCLRPHLQLETVLQQCLQLLWKTQKRTRTPSAFPQKPVLCRAGFLGAALCLQWNLLGQQQHLAKPIWYLGRGGSIRFWISNCAVQGQDQPGGNSFKQLIGEAKVSTSTKRNTREYVMLPPLDAPNAGPVTHKRSLGATKPFDASISMKRLLCAKNVHAASCAVFNFHFVACNSQRHAFPKDKNGLYSAISRKARHQNNYDWITPGLPR